MDSIHSIAENDSQIRESTAAMMVAAGMTPELLAIVEQYKRDARENPEREMLISHAVKSADCDKIRLLIKLGADLNYRSKHGGSLLSIAAYAERMDVVDLLLEVGAPVDDGSAIQRLSYDQFDAVEKLLERGADPAPLKWTPLHHAVALGTLRQMEDLLAEGADPEARDHYGRTAFLLAIETGDTAKTSTLLAHGARREVASPQESPPAHYPIPRDDLRMLQWLFDQGFDIHQKDGNGHGTLFEAVRHSAVKCFKFLLTKGGPFPEILDDDCVSEATSPEIIGLLYERGADLTKLERPALRDFIGLGNIPYLPVGEAEYLEGRFRQFGTSNPERMKIPFWDAMIRCGWEASQATDQFGDSSCGRSNPVWCHHRFGMSLTKLPDGRFVQIAGEHEDHYDPDFCIYNEVIVHDGRGGFEVFGYPEDIFPPTDFHSATLVMPWIYVIGSLGYRSHRKAARGETPVYRWHVETGVIERVVIPPGSPGWIYHHQAELHGDRIRIYGGRIETIDEADKQQTVDNEAIWELDLNSLVWIRV